MWQALRRVQTLWYRNWEIGTLVVIITGVALLLRLVNLTAIPTGMHGDEAIVGMEGQRVLREVLIDPYSPSALGQPAAPFYLSALTVWIWDNTVFAVRISAVIFGTLAIPALFVVVRRSLGLPTALLAATLLMVMGWHIHYSRIAFPLPAWPLWVILTAGILVHAVTSRSPGWWAAAGAMAGAGIYVYNAHTLTLLILSLFAGGYLVSQGRLDPADALRNASAFAGSMLASLLPMLWFVLNNTEMYFRSIDRHSVRDTTTWQELGNPFEQATYLYSEYLHFWWRLSYSPRVDFVDATGITVIVPALLLLLSLAGLVIGMIRNRTPIILLGALIVMLMPVATVLTEQGEMRRTLVIAPFLAMFAAIGIVETVRFARRKWSPLFSWGAVAMLAIVVGTGVTTDLRNYFHVHAESPHQHWVFAEDFYDASMYMQELSADDYVYFMSERWSIDYEPRRFLAPDVNGEDRSDEFGRFGLDTDPELGRPVFILTGDYLPVLDALRAEYPEGEFVNGSRSGRVTFTAFVLPE